MQRIRRDAVPRYSELVLRHLNEGTPEIIWNKLINETAEHYFGKYTLINEACHYKAIGEKIYSSWPCIRMEGSFPWVSNYTILYLCKRDLHIMGFSLK